MEQGPSRNSQQPSKHPAVEYIEQGYRVIPLRGKTPLHEGWQDLVFSVNDVPVVWKPGNGVGLILGDGVIDIDLDDMDAVQLAPQFLPHTDAIFGRISKRYSHWLYAVEGDTPYRAFQDPFYDGGLANAGMKMILELRSKGHQTMAPGSVHPTGEPIVWEGPAGVEYLRTGILPTPTLYPHKELVTASGRLGACVLLGHHWPGRGIRHIVSMALAGALYRLGWELDEVEHFIEQVCIVAGDEEVVDRLKAVRDTFTNTATRETTGWPTLAESLGREVVRPLRSWLSLGLDLRTFQCTDEGNAERLVYYFGENFTYAEDTDSFFVWEGNRWVKDNRSTVRMIEIAVSMNRKILEEALRESDLDRQKALSKWGAASANSPKLAAAVKVVKSQTQIKRPSTQFDTDPMMLNCSNGTLNLVTGGLQPWSREDYITKTTGIPYQKAAQCPMWERFLDDIFEGDAEMIRYLQKAIGYTITGLTTEEKIFICYGTGANGKTTFLETIRSAMGDYASNAAPQTFASKNDNAIRSDLARLRSSRMVTCSELEADKRLATSMLKYMTGGEAITARFLFESEFEFLPRFKPWLASNVKPPIGDSSEGLWRRLVLIPFQVQIQNPNKSLKLQLVERELPGILSWAVFGCRLWQEEGLVEPKQIRDATFEYRTDTDILGAFIDECCVEGGEVTSGALYSSYSAWCQRRGLRPPSNMTLTARVKDKGYHMVRKSKGKTWQGLHLTSPSFSDEEDDVFGAPVEVS